MAFPVVRQEYAPQVRVAREDNAEHIEGLALVPVGRLPDIGHGLDARVVFVKPHLQADAMIKIRREQVIVDLKARLFFRAEVHAADVGEQVELQTGRALEKATGRAYVLARDDEGRLAESLYHFRDPFRV